MTRDEAIKSIKSEIEKIMKETFGKDSILKAKVRSIGTTTII